jgi:hypothetical protein
MSVTQKISCVLWFLGAAGVVFALVSSGWMTGDIGRGGIISSHWDVGVGLRGIGQWSWSELEAQLGAAGTDHLETTALLGRIVFWGGFAVVVSMLPAGWYFRYGKNIGRLWVGIAGAALGLAGIGFCFSLSESKLHYPVAIFFVGIAVVVIGSLVGFAEPRVDPRSKPLEF